MLKIDVMNAQLPMQCLEVLARVYQHPNTNKYTKHFIRMELQRILGREYDIRGFLEDEKYKMSK